MTLTPTNIEWVRNPDGSKGHVWNPVTGCTKVSAGCVNCYAEAVMDRFGKGRKFTDVRCHPERLDAPLRRKKPTRIFVNSMSDLFHPDVPDEFIDRVFAVMALCPQHTFMVLTKRPERMREYLNGEAPYGIEETAEFANASHRVASDDDPNGSAAWHEETARLEKGVNALTSWQISVTPLPNVYLGVSVENQQTADERIPHLLNTPAAVRFASYEPAIGGVDFGPWLPGCMECPECRWRGTETPMERCNDCGSDSEHHGEFCSCGHQDFSGVCPSCRSCVVEGHPNTPCLNWIIAGGESGPGARPMHPDWARSVRDQCQAAGVPFFFKQWGEWGPVDQYGGPVEDMKHETTFYREVRGNTHTMKSIRRVGKAKAGHLLDGKAHREWPEGVG